MSRLSSELVVSLLDRVSGPAKAVRHSIGQLERSAVHMGQVSRMALVGAAGAIAPIAGAYGAASVIREAANFESALTGIQKKAGLTADETARLGAEIRQLATSGELAVPLEEIAAAYERGAAAGIPLDELRQFALLSAKAADAFEMSAIDVGNAAAGFNKALGVPMQDMERLFDLINGLADSGISDESDIVEFLDGAGAMAKTFGLTVQQTAALGAALANLKVPAGEASTAINSILTKLLAPKSLSKRGAAAFKRLVGDTDKFAKKISEDADGALIDLIKRLKSLDTASRTGIIAELFGQEHLDVVSQLVEGSDELIRNLEYAADQSGWAGSLNNSYQLKLDDFWSQWEVARNTLRELMIDAGNLAMPYLRTGLEEAREIFDEIGEGLVTLKTEVDPRSFEEAKKAIVELRDLIGSILTIGNEGSAIESFFTRLAALVNTITGSLKTLREFGQDVGVITDDTPDENSLGSARETLREGGKISPPLRAVDKVLDLATGQNQDPADVDKMRQDLEQLPRDQADDDYYRRRWGKEPPKPANTPPVSPTPPPGPTGSLIDLAPTKQEVDKAALDMTNALQIKGIARMDTSGIDAAIQKSRQLLDLLNQAGSAATGVGSNLDTSGLHADLSRAY